VGPAEHRNRSRPGDKTWWTWQNPAAEVQSRQGADSFLASFIPSAVQASQHEAVRFTANASGFFILSQSGERPER
jgi:hypothetical protein